MFYRSSLHVSFVLFFILIIKVDAQNSSSLTDKPIVARHLFLEAVKHRLSDLKIIQARLKHYQKRLLLKKIIEAGKRSSKDAKLVELIRRTDQHHVEVCIIF
jgi:hypothetical protein